ncbi:MAG TPA: ECF transporter S component [Clostridiales bacterium]|jgi:uncharacterized membrane protein|nr:ECF transporter S component [Clostridiales bacterium]
MEMKTKTLTIAGIFTGLVFLLAMTPVGLIPLGFLNLTIVHIPVIIGTIVLGWKMGLLLGAAFGIASALSAFGLSLTPPSGLATALISQTPWGPFAVIMMCLLPRLLIPLTTHAVYSLLKKKLPTAGIGIAAVVGSFTNTVGYLGIMALLFNAYGVWGTFAEKIFTFVILIAVIAEATVAGIISIPVAKQLLKYRDIDTN